MSDDDILSRASYYELLSLYINRNTPLAARLSCGGTIDAALAVAQSKCQRAIAIVRPPGHHAEPREFMGFCFYNNVAVAAKVVQARTPMKVLILDWCVAPSASSYEFDGVFIGMFTTVRQSLFVGRRFCIDSRQGMAFILRSRMTPPCFISRSTGMRVEHSILAASLEVPNRVDGARDWDCMYFHREA